MDLPLLLGFAVVFGVVMYVVMDGFDLGVGILFMLAPSDADRDLMMNSIAPIWDGNETWLVFGGTLLLAAFPLAYAILLPALYVPLMVMLFALIFRGLAFEFRFRARRFRYVWDWGPCRPPAGGLPWGVASGTCPSERYSAKRRADSPSAAHRRRT